MEQIKDTIKIVFEQLDQQRKGSFIDGQAEILKKVLAKKALKHVKLFNFRKGILNIKVDSSSWLYYLSLQKEDIMQKLRTNGVTVDDVRFSLGE